MSVATEDGPATEGKDGAGKDPRAAAAREISGGDQGLEMVAHSAQGAELDPEEEAKGLEFLLGAKPATVHEIEIQYETAAGMVPLTFVVRTVDTRRVDKIEARNIDQNTGQIDRLTADCEIVSDAAVAIRDGSGREVKIDSDEFLTFNRPDGPFKHASPANALEERFRDQLGLITGVALEIKRASGFSPERVKKAKRLLVAGSLG